MKVGVNRDPRSGSRCGPLPADARSPAEDEPPSRSPRLNSRRLDARTYCCSRNASATPIFAALRAGT